ncbi:MAG TPA: trypsin-like peptidase domain-containing protein [Pirellulaceae bacterium]|nr:trypsin-like peptidase domain-containing protein [Pirellulaceae bacterium]
MPEHRTRIRTTVRPARLAVLFLGAAAALVTGGSFSASELRQSPIVKAVQDAEPSVVSIHGRKTVRPEPVSYGQAESPRQVNGMGTGIVIDPRGYILTNFHVVDGVSNIQVSLSDNRPAIARLIANDPKTDLAVIKIDAKDPLPVIRFGTSCDLMKGEAVIAIGNAYGYEHTVTRGIISALHRNVQVSDDQKYNDLIQSDASINPGNSGGPLMNIDGEVIGINVAVRVGAQGIGFAIPIDEALEVAARLMNVEKLEQTSHGIAGRTVCEPTRRQFVVTGVREESPAAKSGVKAGDVITAIGERKIERALDVELAFLGRTSGEEVTIETTRDGLPQSSAIATSPITRGLKPALTDRVWTQLGLRLSVMDSAEFQRLGTRYRGGLTVLDVRSGSPAAQQGIRRGDVLVGMHVWETISLENMAYVLDREDLARLDPVVFYIVRGSDTLYGHMQLAKRTVP